MKCNIYSCKHSLPRHITYLIKKKLNTQNNSGSISRSNNNHGSYGNSSGGNNG